MIRIFLFSTKTHPASLSSRWQNKRQLIQATRRNRDRLCVASRSNQQSHLTAKASTTASHYSGHIIVRHTNIRIETTNACFVWTIASKHQQINGGFFLVTIWCVCCSPIRLVIQTHDTHISFGYIFAVSVAICLFVLCKRIDLSAHRIVLRALRHFFHAPLVEFTNSGPEAQVIRDRYCSSFCTSIYRNVTAINGRVRAHWLNVFGDDLFGIRQTKNKSATNYGAIWYGGRWWTTHFVVNAFFSGWLLAKKKPCVCWALFV